MNSQAIGASPDGDRATGPSDLSRASASSQSGIPSAGHTPGPWVSVDRNPSSGLDIRGGCHHYPIARVTSYWNGPGPRETEALANCDLIAAAPELLEVVKRLDALWLEDWEPPHADKAQQEPRILAEECLDIWRDARAAIAKALGQ